MKKQKNRFWLFIFSLCPGAGHMYMGLMKMGLSFMLGFMGLIAVTALTGLDVLAVLPLTLYIYAFFHANNIGGMDAEQFAALEDEYLFGIGEWDTSRFKLNMNKRNRNIVAVVCIVLGVCMLWDLSFGMVRSYVGWDNPVMREIYYFTRDALPRIAIAVAIIWFGVSLLRGKRIDLTEDDRRVGTDIGKKPAIMLEEIVSGRKADAGNVDVQKSEAPDVGVHDQNVEVHNAEDQGADTGNAPENEQGGE